MTAEPEDIPTKKRAQVEADAAKEADDLEVNDDQVADTVAIKEDE